MSGGSVTAVVVPLAVVGVLGMAAGAAVSVAVGGSMRALGGSIERRHQRWLADQCAEAAWEEAAVQVIARNARLEVTRAAVRGAKPGPDGPASPAPLPSPLDLRRQSLADLQLWCSRIDVALDESESYLRTVIVHQARFLVTGVATGRRAADAARAWAARTAQVSSETSVPEVAADSGPVRPSPVLRELEAVRRVLERLPSAASPGERAQIATAAARIAAADSVIEARNRLDDLRARADRLEAICASRLVDAREASAFLQALAHVDDATAEPDRRSLQAVAQGTQPMTEGLREQGIHWCGVVRDAAERHHLRQTVVGTLEELGYEVTEEFSTLSPARGRLAAARNGWREHQVLLVLDQSTNQMRAMVVRTNDRTDQDAARQDTEREAEWCSSLQSLREALRGSGADLTTVSLTQPGERPVPVMASREQETTRQRRDQTRRARP